MFKVQIVNIVVKHTFYIWKKSSDSCNELFQWTEYESIFHLFYS